MYSRNILERYLKYTRKFCISSKNYERLALESGYDQHLLEFSVLIIDIHIIQHKLFLCIEAFAFDFGCSLSMYAMSCCVSCYLIQICLPPPHAIRCNIHVQCRPKFGQLLIKFYGECLFCFCLSAFLVRAFRPPNLNPITCNLHMSYT